jgi:hypothetical protein
MRNRRHWIVDRACKRPELMRGRPRLDTSMVARKPSWVYHHPRPSPHPPPARATSRADSDRYPCNRQRRGRRLVGVGQRPHHHLCRSRRNARSSCWQRLQAAALRRRALNLAKASSIGSRSGEYRGWGGRRSGGRRSGGRRSGEPAVGRRVHHGEEVWRKWALDSVPAAGQLRQDEPVFSRQRCRGCMASSLGVLVK